MDYGLRKVFAAQHCTEHSEIHGLHLDVLLGSITVVDGLQDVEPLVYLASHGERRWQALIEAVVTQKHRSAIVEEVASHFVHMADYLQHELFVLSQELYFQDVHELGQPLTIPFVVSDHQIQNHQDLVIQVI